MIILFSTKMAVLHASPHSQHSYICTCMYMHIVSYNTGEQLGIMYTGEQVSCMHVRRSYVNVRTQVHLQAQEETHLSPQV